MTEHMNAYVLEKRSYWDFFEARLFSNEEFYSAWSFK